MIESIQHVRIVLVNVQGPRNVGSACRAMKTMGLQTLHLVGPDPGFPDSEVRKAALHAFDVYENARRFDSLEEALSDSRLVAGYTRRRGFKRDKARLSPAELAEEACALAPQQLDILFGNEEHGLTNAELDHCTVVVTIPTDTVFPSLNVSQAVQIACYELCLSALGKRGSNSGSAPGVFRRIAPRAHVDRVVSEAAEHLEAMGLFKLGDRQQKERYLRDWMVRARMTRGEVNELGKLIHKIRYVRPE